MGVKEIADYILSFGNVIFAFALLPSVFGKSKPAAWTSLITFFVLCCFSVSYGLLRLPLAAALNSVNAVLWGTLFWQKRHELRKS